MIEVKKYISADAVIISGNRDIVTQANHNQAAGPGFTVFDGKTPIACGGIRVQGVGMAWFIFNEQAQKEHLKTIIREAKEKLDEMQRNNELCEVYAESDNADVWLKHLGFKKSKLDILVR